MAAKALVWFLDDPHRVQRDPLGHQQAELADEEARQLVLGDLRVGNVELEPLGLQSAPVEEGDLGVELGSILGHAPMMHDGERHRRPGLFILPRVGKHGLDKAAVWQDRYQLRLWCGHADQPHPGRPQRLTLRSSYG